MPTRRENKLVCIKANLKGETEKAFRIYDGKTTEWVPKRFVEHHVLDSEFEMPEWLAMEKGFI